MIDAMKLKQKADELNAFLDQVEHYCDDLKFGSHVQPDSITKKSLIAERKGLVKILLMFRPKSNVLNEHEKSMENLWN